MTQGQSSLNFSGTPAHNMSYSINALTTQTTSGDGSWIVNVGASHHMSLDVIVLNIALLPTL